MLNLFDVLLMKMVGGGSGGGGSGGGTYDANLIESDGNYSLDKTFEEITAAVKAGMIVRVIEDDRYFNSAKSDTKNNAKGGGFPAHADFYYLFSASGDSIYFYSIDVDVNIAIELMSDGRVSKIE